MLFTRNKMRMPKPEEAPKGRQKPMLPPGVTHSILDHPLQPPFPDGIETAIFGLGCFWGAERLFWQIEDGIWTTAVGYAGGLTPNPTYEEVCSGSTGHTEVVLVGFDPNIISYEELLKKFWEAHDPTQGYRQGNDIGTQYRSAIYATTPGQLSIAEKSRDQYQTALKSKGFDQITTEIALAPEFYYAEDYHQQYLAKVPSGYCGLAGTGVSCPAPVGVSASHS